MSAITDNAQPTNYTTQYYVSGLYGSQNQKRGEIVDPLGAKTTTYFNKWGSPIQTIDPIGRVASSVFDSHRRLTRAISPEFNEKLYTYDVRHNMLTEALKAKLGSALPNWTQVTNTYVEGSAVATCTNLATCNKVASSTDAKGNVTTYSYNATLGFLTRVVGAATLAPQTDYCYAPQAPLNIQMLVGTIAKVSGTVNRVSSYTYNSANKYVLASSTVDPATTFVVPASATSGSCSTTTNRPLKKAWKLGNSCMPCIFVVLPEWYSDQVVLVGCS